MEEAIFGNNEDEELLKVARERLANPDPVEVDINALYPNPQIENWHLAPTLIR